MIGAGSKCAPEQSLVVETAAGSVIQLGCAHIGVAEMVSAAEAVVPDGVALLAGGFQ